MTNLKNSPVFQGYLKWCKDTDNPPKYEQYLVYFGRFADSNDRPFSRNYFQGLLQRLSDSYHQKQYDRGFSSRQSQLRAQQSQQEVFRDR